LIRVDEKDEEKFRELQSRDREMQAFIDGYDEKKAGSARMTAEAQANIVRLLERISLVRLFTPSMLKA
jgi:hypothetical protein